MVKHCCWGKCTSSTKNGKKYQDFVPFPKPNKNKKLAQLWISRCRRKYLSLRKITKHTYICKDHFDAKTTEFDWKINETLVPVDAWGKQPILRKTVTRQNRSGHKKQGDPIAGNQLEELKKTFKREKQDPVPIVSLIPMTSPEQQCIDVEDEGNFFKFLNGSIF